MSTRFAFEAAVEEEHAVTAFRKLNAKEDLIKYNTTIAFNTLVIRDAENVIMAYPHH